MRIRKFWNADKIISMTAFVISIGTFIIFIYQTRLIQIQQYASVLPYLQIWNSGVSKGQYKLILANQGIGPAFIRQIKIHYKNKVYLNDPATFYTKTFGTADSISFISSSVYPGQVIPAGSQLDMLLVENSPKAASNLRKVFGDESARVEVIYTSVYEEVWQLNGMSVVPVKLDD